METIVLVVVILGAGVVEKRLGVVDVEAVVVKVLNTDVVPVVEGTVDVG